MAKNFKKGLSAVLALLMCASSMSTAAFAEGGTASTIWMPNGEMSLDIESGKEAYNYMIVAYKPSADIKQNYYYYETSNHTIKKEVTGGGAVHLIPLVDTNANQGTWSPDGPYEAGVSNYEVVYCCDAATASEAGIYYKRVNLEDSEYYSDAQAAQLRSILTNSYPYLSVEDTKAYLKSVGFAQADELDRSELISATQAAVWTIANEGNGDSFVYNKTAKTGQKLSWGGYMHDFSPEINSFTDSAKTGYVTLEGIGNRINALKEFLLDLDASYAPANQVIITNLDVSAPKMVEEGVFEVDVDVLLNGSGSSANDDIALNIYVGDEVVSTQEIVLGTKEYSATVTVEAGETVKAVVSGTQILPTGVYFYVPEPQDISGGGVDEEGNPLPDGIATSREVSQNLIGVAAGPTKVHAEKEYTIEMLTVDLKVSKVDDEGEALAGAEFALYKNETLVAKKAVDGNGELVFEDLIPGTYELVETKAPEGFVLPEKAIEIEVTKEGYVTFDGEKIEHFRSEAVEGVPVKEALDGDAPKVTVDLTPGKTTVEKVATKFGLVEENGAYDKYSSAVREVKATTGKVEVTYDEQDEQEEQDEQVEEPFTSVQSALKFDRNDTADQKAQKKARELYTDTGHFADPASITVTDAPEGYPYKYVGFGDYSGHYVSHVKVIYKRDEAGNAIKDADGNYVIDHLEHASSGTPLYYGTELVKNPEGPFHYATGTRPQQFLLMDETGATVYAYCIDLDTGAESGNWYTVANLEDNDYYASEEAENHVRNIVENGYWGTEEKDENGNELPVTGSLASLKEALKAAVKNGTVEDEYNVRHVNRKKFTTGYELQEGEYHYGSYVYWDIDPVAVTLTDEIIDAMTEGEALDAMQAAIWSWANGSNATLNGEDRAIVGDLYASSSQTSDSLNGKNDPEGAARTKALYQYLMSLNDPKESTDVINDKTFAKDMTLTVGKEVSDGIYEAELNFTLAAELSAKDNLTVALTYVDAERGEVTIEAPLNGEGALKAENGCYTIDGLKLKAGEEFNFALNIYGEQYLEKGAYILTAQGGIGASQTFVTLAEGYNKVDITKSVEIVFSVDDYAEARYDRYSYIVVVENTPETPPTVSFKSGEVSNISFMLIDAEGNIEFLRKIDVAGETSFEIPAEEGKISAVFVKQGNAQGMFWFSEEVDENIVEDTIECVDDNNPSYKGYSAVAFGEGAHSYEFKNGKTITYTFTGSTAVLDSDSEEPDGTESDGTESDGTESDGTESDGTESDGTESDGTESDGTESDGTESDGTEEPETPEEPTIIVVNDFSELNVKVTASAKKGVSGISGAIIGDIRVVYIPAQNKLPAVIWTSEEVDDLGAVIEALDVEGDAEYVYGFGKQKIEYQHNSNKTKTVTYTFEIAD